MRAVAGAAKTLRVLFGATFEVLVHFDKVFCFEGTNRPLHLALGHRHHRITGRFLIARVDKGVQ